MQDRPAIKAISQTLKSMDLEEYESMHMKMKSVGCRIPEIMRLETGDLGHFHRLNETRDQIK